MNVQLVKIKSKKSIGVQPVYDISVEDAHHYILESGTISHNSGFIYASSIVVAMKKLKLKEDASGNKVSEVNGIRAACKIMKTRYAKPFETVQVKIPYLEGMSPYSGLTDMLEKRKILNREGNRLVYNTLLGEQIKQFRKAWEANTNGCLDTVMTEYEEQEQLRAFAAKALDKDNLENPEEEQES